MIIRQRLRGRTQCAVSFLLCVCASVGCARRDSGTDTARASADIPAAAVFGWVGLYTSDIIGRLENENRIDELCPGALAAGERARCRGEQLATSTFEIAVHDAPSDEADTAGVIVVRATPGQPLAFSFRDAVTARDFVPDLFLDDWGYGPYAHMTVTGTRSSWVRLPRDPFPTSAWIDASRLDGGNTLLLISDGDIVTSALGDFVVAKVDASGLMVRAEQPADMWCRDGPAPARSAVPARTLTREQLFDTTGRLVVRLKYLKGC